MQNQFNTIPDITKNLIIINLLMLLAAVTLGDNVSRTLMIHYVENDNFQPYQLVTAFFMHADIVHLFFNMFVLFMLGRDVEYTLGPKKYLFLYLSAGFGANLINMGVDYVHAHQLMQDLNPAQIAWSTGKLDRIAENLVVPEMNQLARIWHAPALGASGATFGVMFSFAMLYPNRMLMLLFPPIPVKAKYLVVFLAVMEFSLHVSNVETGIGHLVHLAGAGIAVAIIWFWRKQGARF